MVKNSIKVTVISFGATVVFDDAENSGAGSAAYAAIKAKRDIEAMSDLDKITIIPYHAVQVATIEITVSTVDDPKDATCPTEGD